MTEKLRARHRQHVRADRATGFSTVVASIALTLLILEAGADLLPDEPLFWVITWDRLCILVGLLALAGEVPGLQTLRTRIDVPIALLVGAGLVASVLSGSGLSMWRWQLTGVGAFYLTVLLRRIAPGSWATVRGAVVLAVAAPVLVAMRQWNQQTPTGFCRASIDGSSSSCLADGSWIRVIGTFSNPNLLVAFLVMAVPLVLAYVLRTRETGTRSVAAVLLVLTAAAALLTFSRGGALALLAGLLTTVVLLKAWRLPKGTLMGAYALGVLGVVVIVLTQGLAGVRGSIWQQAVVVTATHPLGVGLGNGGSAINARVDYTQTIQHAHNLWLTVGVELGWIGLVAITWLGFAALSAGIRHARAASVVAPYAVGSLVALGTVSMMDTPTNAVRVALLAWVVIGLVVTSDAPTGDEGAGPRHSVRR